MEPNYILIIHIQIELVMAISNIVLVLIGFAPFYLVNFGLRTSNVLSGPQEIRREKQCQIIRCDTRAINRNTVVLQSAWRKFSFDYTVIKQNYVLIIHIQIQLVMAISNMILVSIGFAPFYFVNFGHVTFTKYYHSQIGREKQCQIIRCDTRAINRNTV